MEAGKRHHRRSIRWVGHDYAQAGWYFVAICTHRHVCLFGRVVGDAMQLNAAGVAVRRCWVAIPAHFPQVELDAFVVMPNHVHGILMITPNDGPGAVGMGHPGGLVGANNDSPVRKAGHAPMRGAGHPPISGIDSAIGRPRGTTNTVGSMVRGFKIGVTRWMRRNTRVRTVWQRSFYEHVIRRQRALQRIRRYIAENPAHWAQDPYGAGE